MATILSHQGLYLHKKANKSRLDCPKTRVSAYRKVQAHVYILNVLTSGAKLL